MKGKLSFTRLWSDLTFLQILIDGDLLSGKFALGMWIVLGREELFPRWTSGGKDGLSLTVVKRPTTMSCFLGAKI